MPVAVYTVGVRSLATIVGAASAGCSLSTRIGTGGAMPAWRSTTASDVRATHRPPAPAPRAARATGTAPWPYPSAFTTAQTPAGATTVRSSSTLAAIASRSTSAHAQRSA